MFIVRSQVCAKLIKIYVFIINLYFNWLIIYIISFDNIAHVGASDMLIMIINDVLLLLFKDIKYVAIFFFNLNHILTDESISMVFAVILSFVFSNSANIVHSENLTSPFCH